MNIELNIFVKFFFLLKQQNGYIKSYKENFNSIYLNFVLIKINKEKKIKIN